MRDVMLIVHFLGLAMGVGTSFAFMFLGFAGSKMDKAEAAKFSKNTFILSRMGHIGLALLILSGGYLMTPYWSILPSHPMLITKLSLVVILAILVGIISMQAKKAINNNSDIQLKKTELLGKFTMLISIVIVILAVMIFH